MIAGRCIKIVGCGVMAGAITLGQPTTAYAHLVTTGLGPVYDGIGHLLMTPEDLMSVLALALYAGLRGPTAGRWVVFALPVAWLAGGLVGMVVTATTAFPLPAITILLLGTLVATDLKVPASTVAGLAIVVGLIHGFLNGVALRDGLQIYGLVGILITLFVLVTLASALAVVLGRSVARVGVRVAGSWLAAIGLLMIGWALR